MRRILLSAFFAVVFAVAASASQTYDVKLEDGASVRIEACSAGIFRIRFSQEGVFPESLMERYGVIRKDWDGYPSSVAEADGLWTMNTSGGKVIVDRKKGTLCVQKADGTPAVREIRFSAGANSLSDALAEIINKKYADMHVASNGGIIGDDDGTFSEKDMTESGDVEKSGLVSIAIADGERFYGGGSTSREHIQHRGELLRMWTTYQHTEIPMPFMMSSEGWGIYNNTTRKNFFDVGSFDSSRMNIYNTCRDADIYIFLADTMPGILDLYTDVTGKPYVLPKWAYGLGFGPNMKEDQWHILNDAVNFRRAEIPCDFFWLEPQWMSKRYDFSTAKKWNQDRFSVEPYWLQDKFPKKEYPRLFIGKLKAMGFRLGLWLCEEYDLSLVEEDAVALAEGRDTSGQEHWMDHLKQFMDAGVSGFKLDPARTIDEHTFAKYYNGCTDKEMHNLNQVLLVKQMQQMTRSHTGKRSWHHYCGGWSGVQHWGAATSGDNGGGKTALFDQLNLGMSSYMNTSCDVMSVEKELEMQSLHFGIFLPWMQINSWFSMMHPFYYSEEEGRTYKDYIKLRYALMPYIYSAALEGAVTGMPIVRAMPLVFPEDRNVDDMCWQYMFGGNLAVGIFTDSIYLPAGGWTDWWTGERIVSRGETITRPCPAGKAGLLFVRDGAVVPCQPEVQYVGTKPFDRLVLKIFPGADSEYVLYEDDGDSYAYENGGVAFTRMVNRASENSFDFTLGAVDGGYEGMPSGRDYTFEFFMGAKPSKVLVDGKAVRDWTWSDGVLSLELGNIDVKKETKITVR